MLAVMPGKCIPIMIWTSIEVISFFWFKVQLMPTGAKNCFSCFKNFVKTNSETKNLQRCLLLLLRLTWHKCHKVLLLFYSWKKSVQKSFFLRFSLIQRLTSKLLFSCERSNRLKGSWSLTFQVSQQNHSTVVREVSDRKWTFQTLAPVKKT